MGHVHHSYHPAMAPATLHTMRAFMANANEQFARAGMSDMEGKVRDDGTLAVSPNKPRSAQVISSGDGATVLWKRPAPGRDSNGVHGYNIYRDGKKIATVHNTTWFQDPDGDGGDHTYEVRAIGGDGLESPAASANAAGGSSGSAQAASGADQASAKGAAGAAGAAGASGAPGPVSNAVPVPQIAIAKIVQPGVIGVGWNPVPNAVAYGIYENGKLIGHVTSPVFAAKIAGTVNFQVDAVMADGTRSAKTKVIPLSPQGAPAGAITAQPAAAGAAQGQGQATQGGFGSAAGTQGNQMAANQAQAGAAQAQQSAGASSAQAGASQQQAAGPSVRAPGPRPGM
jgi:hypothetical protein